MEKEGFFEGDLGVKEGEYLELDPEDMRGYVDPVLLRMIREDR